MIKVGDAWQITPAIRDLLDRMQEVSTKHDGAHFGRAYRPRIRSGSTEVSRALPHLGYPYCWRESLYGHDIGLSAAKAAEARKEADLLACQAWTKRMLGYKGPAQPSPTIADALNAGMNYLEVHCLGCNTRQTVALGIIRRPRDRTYIHELERYMRCKNCSEARGYPYKRSHLVALRSTKISASDPPAVWWPGER